MTFVVRKRIDLSFMGEGWEQAYIILNPFTFEDNANLLAFRSTAGNIPKNQQEARKSADDLLELFLGKFIEGKGYDGKQLIDITKDNVIKLPMEIITHTLSVLQGATAIPPNG